MRVALLEQQHQVVVAKFRHSLYGRILNFVKQDGTTVCFNDSSGWRHEFALLSDPAIYQVENQPPASVAALRERYRRWERRGPPARTMIPVLALALILVNVYSRPYLRWAERRWLATDTLMSVDPNGGFTRLETRVTQRLKAEIQKAAEEIAE